MSKRSPNELKFCEVSQNLKISPNLVIETLKCKISDFLNSNRCSFLYLYGKFYIIGERKSEAQIIQEMKAGSDVKAQLKPSCRYLKRCNCLFIRSVDQFIKPFSNPLNID